MSEELGLKKSVLFIVMWKAVFGFRGSQRRLTMLLWLRGKRTCPFHYHKLKFPTKNLARWGGRNDWTTTIVTFATGMLQWPTSRGTNCSIFFRERSHAMQNNGRCWKRSVSFDATDFKAKIQEVGITKTQLWKLVVIIFSINFRFVISSWFISWSPHAKISCWKRWVRIYIFHFLRQMKAVSDDHLLT